MIVLHACVLEFFLSSSLILLLLCALEWVDSQNCCVLYESYILECLGWKATRTIMHRLQQWSEQHYRKTEALLGFLQSGVDDEAYAYAQLRELEQKCFLHDL